MLIQSDTMGAFKRAQRNKRRQKVRNEERERRRHLLELEHRVNKARHEREKSA